MLAKNDVVIIELDRPREIRYGHKALKMMTAMIKDLDLENTSNMDLETLEKIIYCGILADARKNNEELKLEQMEDLLDMVSQKYVIEKMEQAMQNAFGVAEEKN